MNNNKNQTGNIYGGETKGAEKTRKRSANGDQNHIFRQTTHETVVHLYINKTDAEHPHESDWLPTVRSTTTDSSQENQDPVFSSFPLRSLHSCVVASNADPCAGLSWVNDDSSVLLKGAALSDVGLEGYKSLPSYPREDFLNTNLYLFF